MDVLKKILIFIFRSLVNTLILLGFFTMLGMMSVVYELNNQSVILTKSLILAKSLTITNSEFILFQSILLRLLFSFFIMGVVIELGRIFIKYFTTVKKENKK